MKKPAVRPFHNSSAESEHSGFEANTNLITTMITKKAIIKKGAYLVCRE
jgi:hypothetical protein